MDKENAFADNLAPRHNIFKPVDTKDYEYFADLNRHDEDMVDVPDKGKAALKDLYRLSYQIGEQLRAGGPDAQAPVDRAKTQGELFVRSKWLHTWKKRYGSVANHAQFGPVLFLFAYDKEGNVDLKSSQMICLVDSSVKLSRNIKSKDGKFKCEFVVNTQKRRHVFAAADAIARDFWIDSIKTLA